MNSFHVIKKGTVLLIQEVKNYEAENRGFFRVMLDIDFKDLESIARNFDNIDYMIKYAKIVELIPNYKHKEHENVLVFRDKTYRIRVEYVRFCEMEYEDLTK